MTQPAEESDAAPGPGDRPLLNARLLGPMLVTLNGRRVDTTSSRRTRYLLAYLLLHRRSAVPRDVLMETFWPDSRPEAARNSLHVALTGVRRVLGRAWPGEVLVRRHGSYQLVPELPIWVDVDEFERFCGDGRRADRLGADELALAAYAAADRLYGGDLLAEDPYADWASWSRESLRLDLLDVQRRLAELHAAAGDHAAAVLVARRALEIDPCNEPLHRQLMRSYRETDQVHLALTQFHRCAEVLWREHRVGPSAETVELHGRLHGSQRTQVRRTA
jgi:SARP family transcriptional regulator, regulator of embCAB operon